MRKRLKNEIGERSAGILIYRWNDGVLEVVLGHCGGRKWAKRNVGSWNIPKGHVKEGESDITCALREFNEETGLNLELPEFSEEILDLGEEVTKTGKVVKIFAIEKDFLPDGEHKLEITSNYCVNDEGESVPELDKAFYFTINVAKRMIFHYQEPFLEKLEIMKKFDKPITESIEEIDDETAERYANYIEKVASDAKAEADVNGNEEESEKNSRYKASQMMKCRGTNGQYFTDRSDDGEVLALAYVKNENGLPFLAEFEGNPNRKGGGKTLLLQLFQKFPTLWFTNNWGKTDGNDPGKLKEYYKSFSNLKEIPINDDKSVFYQAKDWRDENTIITNCWQEIVRNGGDMKNLPSWARTKIFDYAMKENPKKEDLENLPIQNKIDLVMKQKDGEQKKKDIDTLKLKKIPKDKWNKMSWTERFDAALENDKDDEVDEDCCVAGDGEIGTAATGVTTQDISALYACPMVKKGKGQVDNRFRCLNEDAGIFTESLLNIGCQEYPKYNQVLILAGGAGSGKGFQLQNIIGLHGKVLDVDKFKEMALHNAVIQGMIKRKTGVDLRNHPLNLKNPADVSFLHQIVKDTHLEELWWKNREATKTFDNKPNLIFDKTCKTFSDIVKIRDAVLALGYQKENIHLVWVLNKISIALQQNQKRERQVDPNILISTHKGVSQTMQQFLKLGDEISQYIDGDIWISFNQANVDVFSRQTKTGEVIIDKMHAFKVKSQGKPEDPNKFQPELIQKIKEYTEDERLGNFLDGKSKKYQISS